MEPEAEGGKLPAPGALALVQAFVNTADIEEHVEELAGPERLRAWLAAHGLLASDEPVSDADLGRALGVREALRALLEANNGAPIDADAVASLNLAAATAPLRLRFDGAGHAQLAPDVAGIDGALGHLLAIVYTAMMDGTWARLKACRCQTCRWAFYDYSRNRSAAWCTMTTCGSRSKARAYRQRRRAAGGVA